MPFLRQTINKVIQNRQILFRILLVWSIGLVILRYDENQGFDLRFKLRSAQPISKDIVVINISKQSWDKIINPNFPSLLKSARPLSDSYFWSTEVWNRLLSRVLDESPSVIVVDLFFDRSVPIPRSIESAFKLEKVIWRAELDQRYGYKRPRFAIDFIQQGQMSERSLTNIALGYTFKDYDSVVRRYQGTTSIGFLNDIPKKSVTEFLDKKQTFNLKNSYINYRGPYGTYPTIEITNVLNKSYPPNFFRDKIVLIGSNSMEKHFIKTPIGYLTRTEYSANVIDNILNDLWVKFLDIKFYFVYLLTITLLCFFILYLFTQSLAIYFLILTAVSLVSISILAFDVYNLWVPILSPLSILVLSYVILLNYLLSRSEYQAWKSQKKEESILEMNELKNNFVSLFSHDLKTPLAKIHAISDVALNLNNKETSDTNENFKKIKHEAQELDRYIQSILQVTRIEAGEFNLNITPYDINELVNEAIDLIKPLANLKQINIDFHEEPLFPVEIDIKLIKEVILNLLDNAIKYCPERSLIHLETSDLGDNFSIKISDNGPGINEDEQKTIFDKFYQSKNVETNKKGTGLGLYLVRYFVEIHHGNVSLESKVGLGTSFTITLPYTQYQPEV